MDPCSSLYSLTDGSVVEVSAVMEKVLALNTDEYMFEVIFSVGFMWEEDRSMLLPKATAAEMEACPDNFKCGSCFFDLSQPHDACYPRMDSGWTNTRAPDEWAAGKLFGGAQGLNKCCQDLWNPASTNPYEGVIFPNSKEIEILEEEGPSFYEVPGIPALAYIIRRMRGVFYIPMNFQV